MSATSIKKTITLLEKNITFVCESIHEENAIDILCDMIHKIKVENPHLSSSEISLLAAVNVLATESQQTHSQDKDFSSIYDELSNYINEKKTF